jgi:uncharacterized protein with HEPN domain
MSGRFSDERRGYLGALNMTEIITDIRSMLAGAASDDLRGSKVKMRALERYFGLLSEALRRVPEEWRLEFGPQIDWGKFREIGETLRHKYWKKSEVLLWDIYKNDLDSLQLALERMIARHGP